MSEEKYKSMIISKLSKDFHIKHEWPGTCMGRQVRIDCLIKPKVISEWANPDIIFGIEFKHDESKTGMSYVTDHIKQAIDYSYTEWKGIGRIPIIVCPGISFSKAYANENGETVVKHLMARFGIGELKDTYRGLAIVMADTHFIWTDLEGVKSGSKWTFKNQVGCKK